MDRFTSFFWGFVVILLGASVIYGIGATFERREIKGKDGKIENGAVVKLVRVVDGDTVLVARKGKSPPTSGSSG